MPDNSFHGCLTDPPYGLSFMGHQWDHGVPSAEVWREVLRVLRPGAALLAFGGTRTFHRLTCAIEDAGFEVRDCLMWLYGSGFPKSLDVGKALDKAAGAVRGLVERERPDGKKTGHATTGFVAGATDSSLKRSDVALTEAARQWSGYGSALKPAFEPIIVARKPLVGTIAQNVQAHGCGALAIDASRVGADGATRRGSQAPYPKRSDGKDDRSGSWARTGHSVEPAPKGRWPSNVILDEEAGAALDAQSGHLQSHGGGGTVSMGYRGGSMQYRPIPKGDSGGASRFFYCAKASKAERGKDNIHPTVKPLALTTYLARLILPPVEGSRLLVPFCGSGSEMLGGTRAGWSHVEGIDSWDVAVKIARARTA